MKIYISTFCAMVISGLILSCNDKLDLQVDGRITMDQVFNDYNRTRGYLNSCYSYCPLPGIVRSSFTDEAQDADDVVPGSSYSMWYGGNLTPSNYASYSADGSPWASLFQGVRKCNVFLKNIKTSTAETTEDEKAGWIAQAHTLRALYYLQLIKRYGGVPIFTEPLETNHDFAKDERASFSDVVKLILADCDSALSAPATSTGFPWEIYENQYGMMTRAIPYAIKSEAITYAASPLWSDGTYTWADATAINKDALYQCLTHDYKLFDVVPVNNAAQNAYTLYFLSSSNDLRAIDKETIYQRGVTLSVWQDSGLPISSGMNNSGRCPTQDLVDAYEMANGEAPIIGYSDVDRLNPIINPASGYDPSNPYVNRDPRFYGSIYYNGSTMGTKTVETFIGGNCEISEISRRNTRTGYYLRKYNNYKSALNNNADGAVRLFRLAELYLNFAESAYQSKNPDAVINLGGSFSMSARDAVNAVRRRAGMPDFPSGMTKEAFEKKYRNERRIELAFEEHRFFDVRRWKILSQTDAFVTGMKITKNNSNLSYTRFKLPRNSASDKLLMYPIEQSEVDKVVGVTGVNWQNPGWLD